MRIEVSVTGEAAAAHRLKQIANHAANTRPFFEDAAKVVFTDNKQWWQSPPWVPLDPDTRKQKQRRGQSSRPLIATGRLQRAMTVKGAAGQKLHFGPDTVTIGLQPGGVAAYGLYHHQGRGVPKRELRGRLSPQNRVQLTQALHRHLLGRE